MTKRTNAATVPHDSTPKPAMNRGVANSNLTSQPKQRAASSLSDSVDQVRYITSLIIHPTPRDLISAKVHQTVDSRDASSVTVPSKTHSPIERLPPSPIITAGLQTRGDVPMASGGMGDIWQGEYRAKQVAIKAFRIYPTENLEDAKEVRI